MEILFFILITVVVSMASTMRENFASEDIGEDDDYEYAQKKYDGNSFSAPL